MVTSPDVIQNFPPGKTIRILFYCDHRDMNWELVPQPGKVNDSAESLPNLVFALRRTSSRRRAA